MLHQISSRGPWAKQSFAPGSSVPSHQVAVKGKRRTTAADGQHFSPGNGASGEAGAGTSVYLELSSECIFGILGKVGGNYFPQLVQFLSLLKDKLPLSTK